MMIPDWLPNKINTNYTSDLEWERLVAYLYKIFEMDFIKQRCFFDRKCVIFDNRKIDSPYEEGFWHLISRDEQNNGNRFFDNERASRLPWCKPAITHANDQAIYLWDYLEGNKRINTYIWLFNLDYLIILQNRKRVYFLVTAYWVDGDASRRSLREKYKKRLV